MAKGTTTEAVFQHHMQATMSNNFDEVLKDYTKDSVLILPTETFKGLDGIKAGFAAVSKILTPEVAANFKLIRQEIQGEYVYILWTALPAFPIGGDTFHIHNGKIMMQSVIFQTSR
jgi:ketosteroid isomerase-like protein